MLCYSSGYGSACSAAQLPHKVCYTDIKALCKYTGDTFMAHQMTVTLSDQEYNALKAETARNGQQIETLLHELMIRKLQLSSSIEPKKAPLTGREFTEQQYREGKLLNLPTRRRLTQEEQAERKRLAKLFSGDKMASDMVIEDRGLY